MPRKLPRGKPLRTPSGRRKTASKIFRSDKKKPDFMVGDIVSIDGGTAGHGVIEHIHKTDLIVRGFEYKGGLNPNCFAHPMADCAVVINAEEIIELVIGSLAEKGGAA